MHLVASKQSLASYRLLSIAGLIVALALRVLLADYSFWFDEWASLLFSDQPLVHLWGPWMVRETNPPLFYTLLKYWSALGAHSIVMLRLLPIVAGVANIAVLAWLCRRWHSRRAALIMVLLMALSPGHVVLSQMLRAYAFAMLGASISLGGLLLWWDSGRSRISGMTVYVAGAVLAFYSHTTMLLWQAVAPFTMLLCRAGELKARNWQLLRDLAVMVLAAAIGSGWWLWISFLQVTGHSGNISWIENKSLAGIAVSLVRHGFLLLIDVPLRSLPHRLSELTDVPAWILADGTALVIIATVFVGCAARAIGNRLAQLSLVLLVLLPLAFRAAGFVHPIATDRTLTWLMMFPAIVIACGLAEIRIAAVRAATLALVIATLLLNGIVHCHDLAMEDWRGALARVAATPGGGLVVEHASMEAITQRACRFQFDRESCPFPVITLHSELLSDSWSNGMAEQTMVREAEARKQLSAITSVFAMRSSFYDPMNRLDHAAAKPRVTWNDGFFEGPFPGASFAHPAQ